MNTTENKSPVCIRVIGFGRQNKDSIDAINTLGYDGICAEYYSDNKLYSPSEEDLMIILLGSTNSERVRRIAKTFYEADVLTLVILNRNEIIPTECIDAFTVANVHEVVKTVKALVDPIFMPCSITYDFNDLRLTLSKGKQFLVTSGEGAGKDRIANAIKQAVCNFRNVQLNSIERISIILYYASKDSQPLIVSEISSITEFISALPESIEAIWALYQDEDLPSNGIRLSIIAAGKELKLEY